MIITAEAMTGVNLKGFLRSINEFRNRLRLSPVKEIKTSDHEPLKARINHGRWIVDCPYCTGAEMAWKDANLFICHSCWNNHTHNEFIRVEFPDESRNIENILSARIGIANQNWEPGEDVNSLEKENAEHIEGVR